MISDVHANLPALSAALELLVAEHVDLYMCAGDIVGYGPHPNECVERVADLGARSIAGNHDLMAVGALCPAGAGDLARTTLAWTERVLTDDARAFLAALPRTLDAGGLVMSHGSLDDPSSYVITEAEAEEQLGELEVRFPEASVLLLGHTHRPLAHGSRRGRILRGTSGEVELERGERYVLNPGSVGQARERSPLVRVMVLDLRLRRATFHAARYDVRACRGALRRNGLPVDACHRKPSWIAPRIARARRALRLGS